MNIRESIRHFVCNTFIDSDQFILSNAVKTQAVHQLTIYAVSRYMGFGQSPRVLCALAATNISWSYVAPLLSNLPEPIPVPTRRGLAHVANIIYRLIHLKLFQKMGLNLSQALILIGIIDVGARLSRPLNDLISRAVQHILPASPRHTYA